MLHDSKFAPKIGIVRQNSSVPSVAPYSCQVPAAWYPPWAWCSDGGARGSVACAGSADRDRGGRSPSRTVGSCATSSWSPLSVTARVPTASISRALPTARLCSSPTRRIDKGLVPGVPAFHLSMSLQQFAYRKSISVRCTALSSERKSC